MPIGGGPRLQAAGGDKQLHGLGATHVKRDPLSFKVATDQQLTDASAWFRERISRETSVLRYCYELLVEGTIVSPRNFEFSQELSAGFARIDEKTGRATRTYIIEVLDVVLPRDTMQELLLHAQHRSGAIRFVTEEEITARQTQHGTPIRAIAAALLNPEPPQSNR
jgi:hypothetical protein